MEADPLGFEQGDDGQQVANRSFQPIELGYRELVPSWT
jgi:hypothetical protein